MQSTTTDLTKGRPLSVIMRFALPFMLSDFLQQLYNMVDSIIIGHALGEVSLAGIGVATPIMSIVINFLMGIAMGMGVVLSQYFGRGDITSLKRVLSTGVTAGSAFTVALSAVCVALSKYFLLALATPIEAIGAADVYLKIIFAGGIFTFLYNYYMFSLRAVGNSLAPLIILIICVAINAGLDLVLILCTSMGIAGAAVATVAAQAISVLLCAIYTRKRVRVLCLSRKDWVFDRKMLKVITSYGLSVGLQQVVIYAGRIAVQGLVNTYGTAVMGGVNNATRLDALLQTPLRGYTNALTNYYAQNWGAGYKDRIVRGYKESVAVSIINAVIFIALGYLLARPLSYIFIGSEGGQAVIDVCADFLKAMVSGYFFVGAILIAQSLFKGVGKIGFLLTTTISSIIFRVALSYIFDRFWGIKGMYWAVPASWLVAGTVGAILTVVTYRRHIRAMPQLTSDAGERILSVSKEESGLHKAVDGDGEQCSQLTSINTCIKTSIDTADIADNGNYAELLGNAELTDDADVSGKAAETSDITDNSAFRSDISSGRDS